ncbi:MAG: type III-A CRISPR-associated RAMP protein Csm4 [Phreatobacter sp.]
MLALDIDLRLDSDLGTPMSGDTLFGQLCWQLRLREGEARLAEVLQGYGVGHPFLVVSDAMPRGFLPKPIVPPPPLSNEATDAAWTARKAWIKRRWLPSDCLRRPLAESLDRTDLPQPCSMELVLQPHNSINRLTGTTGAAAFAPFLSERMVVAPAGRDVTLRCLLDEERLRRAQLLEMLSDIGRSGFGRDASTGLGRFCVTASAEAPVAVSAPVLVTLAPAALHPQAVNIERSYWKPLVRFGRHGGPASGGAVFKAPVLLAAAGASITVENPAAVQAGFIGRGLGGDGRLSKRIPGTVHQGYAPIVPVDLTGWTEAGLG